MINYSHFQRNKSLKSLSTFGIGGEAKYFIEVADISLMESVVRFCRENSLDFIVIGKGSNSLFNDRGFDGVVILNKISFCHRSGFDVEVGAGYSFSLLGVQTARDGLSGLEFACGIPASVGGAIYMNAGANGQETKDSLVEVCFIDASGQRKVGNKDQLEFSYRFSSFQKMRAVIVSAKFQLAPLADARSKQLAIIEYRSATQPYKDKSAGCVFRNPAGHSAGALIEKSGLKGFSLGGAAISSVHANFIINAEGATACDVMKLAKHVQNTVKEKMGIELEMEVRCIPYQMDK